MSTDLRPLSLGELLDRTFFLYRKNFALFAGIVALPLLVLLAFQLSGVAFQRNQTVGFAIASALWSLATVVVQLGAYAAFQGATVIAVSHVHLGRPASIAESFAGIKGRILYLALIMLGYGLGIAVGFVLLIIPGIILGLMWALTIPVAVLEDKGLRDSVSRSAELTKGARGRVFVIYLLFAILLYAVYFVWGIPLGIVMAMMSRSNNVQQATLLFQIGLPVGIFISQCLVAPLMNIGLALLYYDQRVRKEAFDLQHMMATLDGGAAESAAASV
jgi:uncharacterized membrane protein